MKVCLNGWKAVSNSLSTIDDWKEWAILSKKPKGDLILNINEIPPMLRRRCSTASKIALSLALEFIESNNIEAGIFCSQHGELHNTVDLFEQIKNKEVLSPNKFSQCVHNTPSGLLSIQKNLNLPFNSISAGCETFQMGLIDAIAQLKDKKNVLFIIFDEKNPEVYSKLNIDYDLDYGLALYVSSEYKETSIVLDIEFDTNHISKTVMPPALIFIAWLLGDRKETLVLPMLKIKELSS
ncbi:beta-ketoacyl synthase chain length factor [Pseudofrancisella aestuarii]|uniref:Beta-ketoacyl synthase chain length factor n=1 Tax=Pseudofrancisella aestuarii TaxID=2670347 RepID=A0ABV9T9A4_9GAMM|nr:beta-ketoacyl synthase chain length factor [Pseudofrancisella aestuarii]